ncbi:hypothetical protein ACFE04_018862 [Oxalis oulophora]
MLRKRTRSQLKNPIMGASDSDYHANNNSNSKTTHNPFFTVPGLFVGLCPKGLSDCDSVRSPTSPLDIRSFPNPAVARKWDTAKVGLSIIDSLDHDSRDNGKILRSSESKNILFGPRMRIKPPNLDLEASKSLPFEIFRHPQIKNNTPLSKESSDVVFEIGDTLSEPFGKTRSSSLADINPNGNFCFESLTTQMDSSPILLGGNPDTDNLLCSKLNSTIGSGLGSFESASDIELSEDYTCVISHGPNPKTVHIFGDSILDCHSNFDKSSKKEFGLPSSAAFHPSADFLSSCYSCNKKLEGEDIYIYRGEKSFCSLSCRSEEISVDEAMEKSVKKGSDSVP